MKLAELKTKIERRNNLLSSALQDRKIKHKFDRLFKVLGIVNKRAESDDHSVIVVGKKHMSWHSTGYSGGINGKDTMKNVPLKQALEYLKDG